MIIPRIVYIAAVRNTGAMMVVAILLDEKYMFRKSGCGIKRMDSGENVNALHQKRIVVQRILGVP